MKLLSSIIFCLFVFITSAQIKLTITANKIENGYELLASNDEIIPVSILFDFNNTNLSANILTNQIVVVAAKAVNQKIVVLSVENANQSYKVSYKYKYNIGDATITNYDSLYAYDLPFQKGNSFKIFQGYNGALSHKNEYALDFTMPIGTPVVCARDGLVTAVVDNNDKTCASPSCMQYNNYITIFHSDGTYAKYTHIDTDGARVKVGQQVSKGTVIALSGNIGYSTGPHLHFECCLPAIAGKKTIPTYFKINDDNNFQKLEEGKFYTKNY